MKKACLFQALSLSFFHRHCDLYLSCQATQSIIAPPNQSNIHREHPFDVAAAGYTALLCDRAIENCVSDVEAA